MNINQSIKLFVATKDHSLISLDNNQWYVYFISNGLTYNRPAIVNFSEYGLLLDFNQVRLK